MITFGDKLKKVEVKPLEPLIGRTEINKKKEKHLVFSKPIERLDDEVKFKIILESSCDSSCLSSFFSVSNSKDVISSPFEKNVLGERK